MLPARFPSSTARPAPLRQHQCPDRPSAPARHAPAGTPGLTWLALLLCVGWSRVALAEDLPTNATARADDAAASASPSTNEPDESTTPASPGPQITTPPPAPARLLVSGGSAGELARLDCGRSGEDLTLAAFAAASARLERAQTAFVMDSGGLLGPHPLTRYAESDAPDGLVALLRALHYRALALDHQSLARLQHPPQRRLLAALQTGGIDLLAHNLRCPEDAAGVQRCQGLQHAGVPLRLHPVGNQMLTVIGVVEPDAVETLPAGLALTPAAGAIAEATRQARAQGAHLVVASYDPGPAADAGGRALSLANGLPEDGRPDLLLIAGRKTPLLFARPRSVAPALSSSSIGGVIEITLRAPQTEQVADITARPEPGAGTPAESLARWKKTTTRSLCNSLVGTLAGGKLTSALDRATLSELAARVVRSRAGVDAALLPEGSLSPHFNGAVPPALRPVDLQLAFPDPVPLVQTRISGKDLLALAGALPEGTTLAGVTRGSKAKVAGQPIEAGVYYSLLTTRAALESDWAQGPRAWRTLPDLELRKAMLDWLKQPASSDLRERMPDVSPAGIWLVRADLDQNFASASVDNPGASTASQLAREDSMNLQVQATLRADLHAGQWSWANTSQLRHRRTRAKLPDEDGDGAAQARFEESEDLWNLRSSASWGGNTPASPWRPRALLELYLEGEVTRPEERDHLNLLARPTVGLRLQPYPKLGMQLSVGTEGQLLDPDSKLRPGVGLGLDLDPWRLDWGNARHLEVQLQLDYFITAPGQDDSLETLRTSLGLAVDIAGPLALISTLSGYGERGDQLGFALDTSVGLRVRWQTRQTVQGAR